MLAEQLVQVENVLNKKMHSIVVSMLKLYGKESESIVLRCLNDSPARTAFIHEIQRQRKEEDVRIWNSGKDYSII